MGVHRSGGQTGVTIAFPRDQDRPCSPIPPHRRRRPDDVDPAWYGHATCRGEPSCSPASVALPGHDAPRPIRRDDSIPDTNWDPNERWDVADLLATDVLLPNANEACAIPGTRPRPAIDALATRATVVVAAPTAPSPPAARSASRHRRTPCRRRHHRRWGHTDGGFIAAWLRGEPSALLSSSAAPALRRRLQPGGMTAIRRGRRRCAPSWHTPANER